MRLLNRLLILSALLLATGCVLEPLGGSGYYGHQGYYHDHDRGYRDYHDRDDHRRYDHDWRRDDR